MASPPPLDDLDLLRAWRAGDREAGGQLVQRHFSAIYRFFTSKLGDSADELTQRTFHTCVEFRDRYQETRGTTFRAFLFGIARNLLLQHFDECGRANRRTKFEEISIADLGGSPSRLAAARQEQEVLLEAMRRIPVDFQIALELHYWEDMGISEIASVLDVAPGTIKSRLFRARGMLRDTLATMNLPLELRESSLQELDRFVPTVASGVE